MRYKKPFKLTVLLGFLLALVALSSAQNLIVDGTSQTMSGEYNYDKIEIINGGTIYVEDYDGSSGGKLTLNADEIIIDSSSAIRADGKGYRANNGGPGGGSGGGSYGGRGGDSSESPYGSAKKPQRKGSAGTGSCEKNYCVDGGDGGGFIGLHADDIVIDGVMRSRGAGASGKSETGGGSGGGIYIEGDEVKGSGTIYADGESGGTWDGQGGGGAGGRIAVKANITSKGLSYSVDGKPEDGEDGTVRNRYIDLKLLNSSGYPLEGEKIEFYNAGTTNIVREKRTDSNGRLSTTLNPNDINGYYDIALTGDKQIVNTDTTINNVIFNRGYIGNEKLTINVLDKNGDPVPNEMVTVYDYDTGVKACGSKTTTGGTFECMLDGGNTYTVQADNSNFTEVKAGNEIDIETNTRIKIVDTDGTPVSNLDVEVFTEQGDRSCRDKTNQEGVLTCSIQNREHTIEVGGDSYYKKDLSIHRPDDATLEVKKKHGFNSQQGKELNITLDTDANIRVYKEGSYIQERPDSEFICGGSAGNKLECPSVDGNIDIYTDAWNGKWKKTKDSVPGEGSYDLSSNFEVELLDASSNPVVDEIFVKDSQSGEVVCAGETNSNGKISCMVDTGKTYDIAVGDRNWETRMGVAAPDSITIDNYQNFDILSSEKRGELDLYPEKVGVEVYRKGTSNKVCEGFTNSIGRLSCSLDAGELYDVALSEYNVSTVHESFHPHSIVREGIALPNKESIKVQDYLLEPKIVGPTGSEISGANTLVQYENEKACEGTTNETGGMICTLSDQKIYDIETDNGIERRDVPVPEKTLIQYSSLSEELKVQVEDGDRDTHSGLPFTFERYDGTKSCEGRTGQTGLLSCGLFTQTNYTLKLGDQIAKQELLTGEEYTLKRNFEHHLNRTLLTQNETENEQIKINGSVWYDDEIYLDNENIELYLDGKKLTTLTTDANGQFSYVFSSPTSTGTHTITLNYTDTYGIFDERKASFAVINRSKGIEEVNVSVQDGGKPSSEKIWMPGEDMAGYSDSDGELAFALDNSSSYNFYSRLQNITQIQPNASITVSPYLEVRTLDDQGNAVQGERVVVKELGVTDKSICDKSTDSNGFMSCEISSRQGYDVYTEDSSGNLELVGKGRSPMEIKTLADNSLLAPLKFEFYSKSEETMVGDEFRYYSSTGEQLCRGKSTKDGRFMCKVDASKGDYKIGTSSYSGAMQNIKANVQADPSFISVKPNFYVQARNIDGTLASGEEMKAVNQNSVTKCDGRTSTDGYLICSLDKSEQYDIEGSSAVHRAEVDPPEDTVVQVGGVFTNKMLNITLKGPEGDLLNSTPVEIYTDRNNELACKGDTNQQGQIKCGLDENEQYNLYSEGQTLLQGVGVPNEFELGRNLEIEAVDPQGDSLPGIEVQAIDINTQNIACEGETNEEGMLRCGLEEGKVYNIKTVQGIERYNVELPEETVIQYSSDNEMLNITVRNRTGDKVGEGQKVTLRGTNEKVMCKGETGPLSKIQCGLDSSSSYQIYTDVYGDKRQVVKSGLQPPQAMDLEPNTFARLLNYTGEPSNASLRIERSGGGAACYGELDSGNLTCSLDSENDYRAVPYPEQTEEGYLTNISTGNTILETLRVETYDEIENPSNESVKVTSDHLVCRGFTGENGKIYCGSEQGESYDIENSILDVFGVKGNKTIKIGKGSTTITARGLDVKNFGISGANFSYPVELENTGSSHGYNIELYGSNSENWKIYREDVGSIAPGQKKNVTMDVSIPEDTSGTIATVTPEINWTSPDGTEEKATGSSGSLEVVKSGRLSSDSNISAEIEEGSEFVKAGEMKLDSIGNDDAVAYYNITDLNWSFGFDPFPPTDRIPTGESRNVSLYVSVPENTLEGAYTGKVQVYDDSTGDRRKDDEVEFNVDVPPSSEFEIDPSSFGEIKAPLGSTETVDQVTVSNTGNQNLSFAVNKQGNETSFLQRSPSTFELSPGEVKNVSVGYSIPTSATGGQYDFNLSISCSPGCDTKKSSISLNVVDVPPAIHGYSYEPRYLKPGETIKWAVNTTDNDAIDRVWVDILGDENITASLNETLALEGENIFNAEFTPEQQEEQYTFRIYSEDTAGLTNRTEELGFQVVPSTTIESRLNKTVFQLENVNADSGQKIYLTSNFSNTGNQDASDVGFDLQEVPEAWSWSTNDSKQIGVLNTGESAFRSLQLDIPAGTSPGTYLPALNTTWTDADGEKRSTYQSFKVEVLENAQLEAESSKTIKLDHDDVKTFQVELDSTGNKNIESLQGACRSSEVCKEFGFGYQLPFNMEPGEKSLANVTVSVPEGFEPGTYNPEILFESESTEARTQLEAEVRKDLNLSLSPENYTVGAGPDTKIQLDDLEVSNLGNQPLEVTPPSDPVLEFEKANLDLNVSDSKFLSPTLNTNSSAGNYTLNLSFTGYDKETFEREESNLVLNLTVYDYSIDIVGASGTEKIAEGDTISTDAEATLRGNNVSSGIDWKVFAGGETADITSKEYSSGTWNIDFTAPELEDGKIYDLRLEGTHNELNATTADIKTGALSYQDFTPPVFESVDAQSAEPDRSSSLQAEVSDTGSVENVGSVNATIQTPSGNNFTEKLSESSGVWTGSVNFKDTGYYDVYFEAEDTAGNKNISKTFFQIYEMESVSGDVKDSKGNGVNLDIDIKRPGTSERIDSISATDGNYDTTVRSGEYDAEFKLKDSGTTIELEKVNHTDLRDPMDVEPKLDSSLVDITNTTGESELKGFAVNTDKLQGHPGQVKMDYSEFKDQLDYVNDLEIYKCEDWNFQNPSQGCDGAWIKKGAGVDANNEEAYANINSFSAYYLVEDEDGSGGGNETQEDTTTGTTGGSGSGGGSGGGGGGLDDDEFEEGISQLLDALEDNRTDSTVEFGTQNIEANLKPGESQTAAVSIQNVLNVSQSLEVSASSNVKRFMDVEEDINLEPGDRQDIVIQISAPSSAEPSSYSGYLSITGKAVDKQLPVNIRITPQEKELLDLNIDPVVEKIGPGEQLRVETSLSNQGYTDNVDVDVALELVDAGSLETISRTSETVAVSTTLDKVFNLNIPEDAPLKRYEVRAFANYSNKDQPYRASSVETIEIHIPFWDRKKLGIKHKTYGKAGLGILLILLISYTSYAYVRKKQLEKRRYEEKIDASTLPSGGTRQAHLGKLAERGSRAFLELEEMKTHSLIAGATGSGKTVTGQIMVEEALKEGVNVIVLDPTAQWSGFLRECDDSQMLTKYGEFGMSKSQKRAFDGNIRAVEPGEEIDISSYLKEDDEGQIIVFSLHQLESKHIDEFIDTTIQQVFDANLPESNNLDTLIVYDEVHRLLEKFGGGGEGLKQLERGAREFRKWGVGMILLSQVISDFSGEIRANIGTTVQMRTQYEKDLNRLRDKYGMDTVKSIVKANVGSGMLQNSEYNRGRPYFVNFRPLLHSPHRLSNEELDKYEKFNKKIDEIEEAIEQKEQQGEEVFELKSELKLARKNLRKGSFNLVKIYLDELKQKL